jgi:D-3-phosphoglycerate dehydrogenase
VRFGLLGELSLMKPSPIIVNTCRGSVIDEAALHAALTSRTIAAAGLDVMVEEPPAKDHPLFRTYASATALESA